MNQSEVQEIITYHKKWLLGDKDGVRANFNKESDFEGVNFANADLREATFTDINFKGANFTNAKLDWAYLSGSDFENATFDNASVRWAQCRSANFFNAGLNGADFSYSNLSLSSIRRSVLKKVNFSGTIMSEVILEESNCSKSVFKNAHLFKANLKGLNCVYVDFQKAYLVLTSLTRIDFSKANFKGANLEGAILSRTDFSGANLEDTNFEKTQVENIYGGHPVVCPESGTFTAWKKAKNYIIKLEVFEDAKRSSATSRECRCDKAKVVAIENIDGSESHITEVNSNYDKEFIYRVGEVVSVEAFDDNRWNECAPGIHFFITREEAARY